MYVVENYSGKYFYLQINAKLKDLYNNQTLLFCMNNSQIEILTNTILEMWNNMTYWYHITREMIFKKKNEVK